MHSYSAFIMTLQEWMTVKWWTLTKERDFHSLTQTYTNTFLFSPTAVTAGGEMLWALAAGSLNHLWAIASPIELSLDKITHRAIAQ